jgi:hypothetical protein
MRRSMDVGAKVEIRWVNNELIALPANLARWKNVLLLCVWRQGGPLQLDALVGLQ